MSERQEGGAMDWREVRAPSLAEMDALARAAFARLPDVFRERCGDVVILVEDFPTEEVCASLDIESPFDLMGLYHGVDLTQKSAFDLPMGPDMVFLYRRPILDFWAEGEETLDHLVTHVLVHEIGHHFGLSDEDMHAIEQAALAPAGDVGG